MVSIGYYFERHLGLAYGIAIGGAGFGTIACGPIIQSLVDNYQLSGTFLMYGGIALQHVVIGMLFRPSVTEIRLQKQRKCEVELGSNPKLDYFKSILNFSILKNSPFVLFIISLFFLNVGMSILFLYLPKYVTLQGLTAGESAFMWMLFGIGSTLSRLFTGLSVGKNGIDCILLYFGLQGICGILTTTFPLYSHTTQGQVAYFALFGIYSGGLNTLINPLAVELVGVEQLSSAYGFICFMVGVGFLIGPPIAGM